MNINTNIIKLSYNNCDYEGETFQNQPQNRGVAIFNSGNSYYGEWKKGLFEGNGLFIHFTGIVIKGNFLQGKLDGYAEIYYCKEPKIYTLWKKGTIYENNLLTNKLNKSPSKNFNEYFSETKNIFKTKDQNYGVYDSFYRDKGYKYFGNWKNSKPNGLGISLSQNSLEIGEFKKGLLYGFCRKIFFNGDIISGEYYNNLLEGSCLDYGKESLKWSLNSFKNNEKTEFIKEGSSEYPPILKFSTDKSPLLQENLPEDIIEKVFLQEILSIYKKNAPNTPIKIPIIEIEVEKKTSNEENFSNIYNKIIDKNNPYASPKLMKRKASPITPMRTFQSKTNSDGFSKNDTIKSPLRKINIAMDPFKLLEVITSKEVSIIKTTQNFNKKSCSPKHTIGKESPSMKIDYKNDLLNSNLNKYNKKILASNTLTNPLCFNGSNQLYKTNSKNFKKATTNNLINTKTKKYSSQKIIPFYTGKDTNPVYILEDDNENEKIDKLESPLNKLITKLKKTPLENQKNNDIFKEIEGVNTLVEAALTEDSLLLKKNIRKKSKSFGLSIGNPYINTPNDILEFFGTDK